MSTYQKYILYQLVYIQVSKENLQRARTIRFSPFVLPGIALKRTNHILEAIGQELTEDELIRFESMLH